MSRPRSEDDDRVARCLKNGPKSNYDGHRARWSGPPASKPRRRAEAVGPARGGCRRASRVGSAQADHEAPRGRPQADHHQGDHAGHKETPRGRPSPAAGGGARGNRRYAPGPTRDRRRGGPRSGRSPRTRRASGETMTRKSGVPTKRRLGTKNQPPGRRGPAGGRRPSRSVGRAAATGGSGRLPDQVGDAADGHPGQQRGGPASHRGTQSLGGRAAAAQEVTVASPVAAQAAAQRAPYGDDPRPPSQIRAVSTAKPANAARWAKRYGHSNRWPPPSSHAPRRAAPHRAAPGAPAPPPRRWPAGGRSGQA